MKLTNINKEKGQLSDKNVVNEAKVDHDDEEIVIPGLSPDDADYQLMKKRLTKLKKRKPELYNKMINWE